MTSPTDDQVLDAVAAGSHHDPHSVLGIHPGTDARGRPRVDVRARRPLARSVTAVFADGTRVPLEHVRGGIWEGTRSGEAGATSSSRPTTTARTSSPTTPTVIGPAIGELDLHLIREGRHEELWRVLGAHVREIDGSKGTAFTVWAPNARAVRVVGDFNSWDGAGARDALDGRPAASGSCSSRASARARPTSSSCCARSGEWVLKADPMARFAEVPPATASVVIDSVVHLGRRRVDERAGARASPCRSRCRSTKCTSARGGRGCRTATPPIS